MKGQKWYYYHAISISKEEYFTWKEENQDVEC